MAHLTAPSAAPRVAPLSRRGFTQLGLAGATQRMLPGLLASAGHSVLPTLLVGLPPSANANANANANLHTDANILRERALQFPRDFGAHPDYRTEWWYLTGYASTAGREWGFQVTFFRSRVDGTQAMQSKFAAKQLVFAHAALTDVQGKKLLHDQRIARSGFGLAQASETDTRVALRDWALQRTATGYTAQVKAADFALDLQCQESQPLLLQGQRGLSRKGPQPEQASYYYSKPQLRVAGSIHFNGQKLAIQSGTAWLDHEWSQALLHPDAVGWDWIGMNLLDGSALTAFQLRKKDGSALWTGGSFRAGSASNQAPYVASPFEVQFQALKAWTSPLTGAKYPIEWLVRTPSDYYTVKAVIAPQELDSRNSTGAVYWEGLSDLFDSNGQRVGRGYLEMTGYAAPLRM